MVLILRIQLLWPVSREWPLRSSMQLIRRTVPPYVFRGDKQLLAETDNKLIHSEPPDEHEQEELDKFIAEIEDAAEREWAAEEAAEKDEFTRLRYHHKGEFGDRYKRTEALENDSSGDEINRTRGRRDVHGKRHVDSDYEDDTGESDSNSIADTSVFDSDADDSDGTPEMFKTSTRHRENRFQGSMGKNDELFKKNAEANTRKIMVDGGSESEDMISDLDNAMWHSEDEEAHKSTPSIALNYDYRSSSDGEEDLKLDYVKVEKKQQVNSSDDSDKAHDKFKVNIVAKVKHNNEPSIEDFESDDMFSDEDDDDNVMWEAKAMKGSGASTARSSDGADYQGKRGEKNKGDDVKRTRTTKE